MNSRKYTEMFEKIKVPTIDLLKIKTQYLKCLQLHLKYWV